MGKKVWGLLQAGALCWLLAGCANVFDDVYVDGQAGGHDDAHESGIEFEAQDAQPTHYEPTFPQGYAPGNQVAPEPNRIPEQLPGRGGSGVMPEERGELSDPDVTKQSGRGATRNQGEQAAQGTYPPRPASFSSVWGTEQPLRAGPNGAWIQGTWAVETGQRASELLETSARRPEPWPRPTR